MNFFVVSFIQFTIPQKNELLTRKFCNTACIIANDFNLLVFNFLCVKHIDFLSSLCNEQQDERNKFVSVEILSDTLPEPDETIIIYLAQPTGDARIATGTPDGGKKVKKK